MNSDKGSSGDMKAGALFDLKVIDVGHFIAGPYCASLLAGLGAEVIKVERPSTGDGARRIGPFPGDQPHLEKSGLFSYLNLGKKGITLNLKTEAGRDIFHKLVAETDVLVENFAPRVMPSLGMTYEDLREFNPRLVMTSISNYGQTGPYRDYKGYEITLSALGGVQAEIGDPDREPLKLGGQQLQFEAGLTAAFATMSAIYYRDISGVGQHIDQAIVEMAATLKGDPIMTYQETGYYRKRNGARPMNRMFQRKGQPPPDPRNPDTYPIAILPCKDGYLCIDPEKPEQWLDLCDMIGRPELKEDPRFGRGAQRGVRADEIDAILIDYLRSRRQWEVFEEATAWRIPVAIVNNMAQLFHDPELRARGFFVPVEHPALGKMEYPGFPFTMSETPWRISRAPLLGEHSREILVERLGYSEEEIKAMAEAGVI